MAEEWTCTSCGAQCEGEWSHCCTDWQPPVRVQVPEGEDARERRYEEELLEHLKTMSVESKEALCKSLGI